jgi:hypothetical protein
MAPSCCTASNRPAADPVSADRTRCSAEVNNGTANSPCPAPIRRGAPSDVVWRRRPASIVAAGSPAGPASMTRAPNRGTSQPPQTSDAIATDQGSNDNAQGSTSKFRPSCRCSTPTRFSPVITAKNSTDVTSAAPNPRFVNTLSSIRAPRRR